MKSSIKDFFSNCDQIRSFLQIISQSLNNMKRNEEAGNSLRLHFHFNVLSNCQLKFCSFICTIKIIFSSTTFGYLWRYWYFLTAVDTILGFSGLHKLFHSDCRHVDNSVVFSYTNCPDVPFRSNYISELNLPTKCEQSVRECLYWKSVNTPINMNSPINQSHRVNHYNMFVWWHVVSCFVVSVNSLVEKFLTTFCVVWKY